MTPEQAIAFINSQVACAYAEMAAMHAANRAREEQGYSHAYDEEAFRSIPAQFGIDHNSVVSRLMGYR